MGTKVRHDFFFEKGDLCNLACISWRPYKSLQVHIDEIDYLKFPQFSAPRGHPGAPFKVQNRGTQWPADAKYPNLEETVSHVADFISVRARETLKANILYDRFLQ